MRTERVFLVLNQQKPSLWLGTSASCFPQEIFLVEPWTLSTCINHWLGSFIMRWRYKDLVAPHWTDVYLEGKENRECVLQMFSKSVHPAAMSTFAKGFRTQSYLAAANMKSQIMGQSSLPQSPGQFLTWFGGSLGWWLNTWDTGLGGKGQFSCLGVSHPIQGQVLAFSHLVQT